MVKYVQFIALTILEKVQKSSWVFKFPKGKMYHFGITNVINQFLLSFNNHT